MALNCLPSLEIVSGEGHVPFLGAACIQLLVNEDDKG